MRIAVTGGAGFIGRNLIRRLVSLGHDVIQVDPEIGIRDSHVAQVSIGVDDTLGLAAVFAGCEVVVHLAGICHEHDAQTFEAVHVDGTVNVIRAARAVGVSKLVLLSYIRARPDCGSEFHESKWRAEECVRNSGLDYTILKASVVFGLDDHWLDSICRLVHSQPLIPHVGAKRQYIRPVAVDDLVDVILEAIGGKLTRRTLTVVGPELVDFCEAVRRVSILMDRHPVVFSAPIWMLKAFAWVCEKFSAHPMVCRAQIRMLSESMSRGVAGSEALPEHLMPRTPFGWDQIRRALHEQYISATFQNDRTLTT